MDAADVTVEREINGCSVRLFFPKESKKGVMESIRSILTSAYEERAQGELERLFV